MDSNKIIFLIIIVILTILLIGIVYSSDKAYSGGADPERGIVIEGIEFNIPEGYEKNNSKSLINQTNTSESRNYVINQETFENADGEEIIISIIDYDNYDVDAKMLNKFCEGTEKKLLNYPGYISVNNSFTQFTYAFENKLVSIKAPNEDLINQILVIEDA